MNMWIAALVAFSSSVGHAVAQNGCYESAQVIGLNAEAGGLLNVRAGPGREYEAIAQIRLGDVVQACGFSDDWTQISYGSASQGWVSGRFLAPIDESEPMSASAARVAPPPPNPEWADAYSRRNYQLGMSLSAFRREPYPDLAESPGTYSVCSDERRADESNYLESRLFSDEFTAAGVVKCAFYRDSTMNYGGTMVFESGLGLGRDQVLTRFYFINPDGESEKYLAWIETGGPSDSFDLLLPSFQTAYGSPRTSIETWRNQAGASFSNDVYTWENDVSSISFKRFGRTVKVFDLEHRLHPLMSVLNARLNIQATAAAGRL